jgi:hypothetical protein
MPPGCPPCGCVLLGIPLGGAHPLSRGRVRAPRCPTWAPLTPARATGWGAASRGGCAQGTPRPLWVMQGLRARGGVSPLGPFLGRLEIPPEALEGASVGVLALCVHPLGLNMYRDCVILSRMLMVCAGGQRLHRRGAAHGAPWARRVKPVHSRLGLGSGWGSLSLPAGRGEGKPLPAVAVLAQGGQGGRDAPRGPAPPALHRSPGLVPGSVGRGVGRGPVGLQAGGTALEAPT